MSRGFSLIEVELALFVVGLGLLAVIGLYPFGFRETTAAREDLVAMAAAEGVLARLVSDLSQTNLTWSVWRKVAASGDPADLPEGGTVFADLPPGWPYRITLTEGDPARMCIGVRVSRTKGTLPAAPLFYSEVRFQGRTE